MVNIKTTKLLLQYMLILTAFLLCLTAELVWADHTWKKFPTDAEIQQAWTKKKAELDDSWPFRGGALRAENFRIIKYHCPAIAERDHLEASGVLISYDILEKVHEGGPPPENMFELTTLSFNDGWKLRSSMRSFKTPEERAQIIQQIFAPNPPGFGPFHSINLTRGRVDRKGRSYAHGFAGAAPAPTEDLAVELNIAENQEFTQGDDFHVVAEVKQAGKPLAGAAVVLKIRSPDPGSLGTGGRGKDYAPEENLVTDNKGRVEWRTFFTACASPGTWRLEANASSDTAQSAVSRKIEVLKLKISSADAQKNIDKIKEEWIASPDIPNGVDQEFISELSSSPPKGFQVNAYDLIGYKRFAPYTCTHHTHKTLKFLNEIRFSPIKERRLLMGGVDYGPISDSLPNPLIEVHSAVALYLHGQGELSGTVLEPWYNQCKETWSGTHWKLVFRPAEVVGGPGSVGALGLVRRAITASPYQGEYPTSGSDGGYNPHFDRAPKFLAENISKNTHQTLVLTYSPVVVMIVDSQQRRAGRLPDGAVVQEIPGTAQAHAKNEDGTYVNYICVPDGQYQVQITGTGDGTFHLVSATHGTLLNYGEQPIRMGEQATLTLRSDHLNQPLTLPDGTQVSGRPGFHVAAEEIATGSEAVPFGLNPNPIPESKLPVQALRISRHQIARPAMIGMRLVSAHAEEAIARGIKSNAGALVMQVTPNSVAAAAGFHAGDLIRQFGSREINDLEDFRAVFYTSKSHTRQSVTLQRGQRQISLELPITPGDTRSPVRHSYTATSGQYQFDYFLEWKLDPILRQQAVTGRSYRSLVSPYDDYRVTIYTDFEHAPDPVASLDSFRQQASNGFLEGKSGWLLLGDFPGVFASGVVGRQRLFTLYRLAFVIENKRFEIDLFTPPRNDPAQVPFVVEAILGTLRQPVGEHRPNLDAKPENPLATVPFSEKAAQPESSPPAAAFPGFDALEAEFAAFEAQLNAANSKLEGKSGVPPSPPLQSGKVSVPDLTIQSASIPPAQTINVLRQKAMEIWNPPVEVDEQDFLADDIKPRKSGWLKSEHDPGKLVELFKPLKLKPGYVLRAYVFFEDDNSSGVVWALPKDAPFPEPDEVPVLEQHLFKAPKPWDALDDFMDAIEGDGSPWSYLAAAMLRRELNEFGAVWHGIGWGSHCLLEADPWSSAPTQPEIDEHCRPATTVTEWEWLEERPQDWAPKVHIEGEQVSVTFYTYAGKYPEKIFRHTETYRSGRYRARVRDQPIAQGTGGYLF